MSIATEIVTMKTLQEVTKYSFISIVDALEKDYHSKQQGFIDTELLYNEENREWTMIQHWASMEEDVYKRQVSYTAVSLIAPCHLFQESIR